ncbi:hypothetical protein [Bremerella sp. P1]|uniref:hypothetical protein n=1 Tax=Bremerella sp. P1 TaxID=3026424 RepID=UPI00236791D8|nr:hypothetical protein [Bremerella sp. P1]WDI44778.1 hypothetical protein PSR63_12610 [Bremerella sp. P1]
MSDQRVIYSSPSNGRYESRDLWAACPKQLIRDEYGAGKFFETDFMGKDVGMFTATQATAGTFTVDTGLEGGVAVADCASATATQGINVQADGAAFVPAAGVNLFFEARVKIADTATGPELFIGLSEIDTAILDTSAMASTNIAAFYSVTDDNVLAFATEDGGNATTEAGVYTMVEDTYVKLGFKIEGLSKITPYINGVAYDDNAITTNIPDTAVVPTFVCQSGGTTDPILYIDWVKCYQVD